MAPYAAAVFLGAFLVFTVQPMMGRFLLPWFGGGAAVWTGCLVFFQTGLLVGYGYAHGLRRWSVRSQVWLHLVLLAAACLWTSPRPAETWQPTAGVNPLFGVWLVLLVHVGPVYVILTATAPLLQRWFELARKGASAYRLYSISNLASFAALVLYPTVLDRYLARDEQALVFRVLLAIGALVIAGAGIDALRRAPRARASTGPAGEGWRLAWWLLPALSSALLVAVTQRLSENVPPMPFLWVLPLGLYLLSYALAFRGGTLASQRLSAGLFLLLLSLSTWFLYHPLALGFLLYVVLLCATLFCACLFLHAALYHSRPQAAGGSSFYLAVAGGGVLGGIAVALAAPSLFSGLFEFPILLGLVLLLALRCLAGSLRPARIAAAFAWLAFAGYSFQEERTLARQAVRRERNAYGVHTVYELQKGEPFHRYELHSGGILHGMQFLTPEYRREPTAYFDRDSGVGLVWRSFPVDRSLNVGVVGLGAGTQAAYANAGDRLRFYEIDPKVIVTADELFTFLADCPADVEVVPGDARLSMQAEENQEYDLLVLDAFTGDAIPVHLLTVECFATYLRHLRPGGILAIHASSIYLDLLRVLSLTARELGLESVYVRREPEEVRTGYGSTWVLLAREPEPLRHPTIASQARELRPSALPTTLWTDERAPLFEVMHWGSSRSAH